MFSPGINYLCRGFNARGGGGHSQYIVVGCAAAHPKRGVLGTGTTQKGGSLYI